MTAALALLVSACGSSATGSASTTGKVPLVVYAAEGYDSTVAKAFQQATGIPTSVYDAHTGLVVSKIEQEGNNPRWGVTWFDGDMAMASLDQQGLLLKGYEPTVGWNPRGLEFLPKDQTYVPTGYTIAATILYNSAAMPQPPSTWNDLLSPSYHGKVGILNPAIAGSAYPMMAGWATQFGGVPQLEAYVTALVNNGAKVYTSPDDELNAIKQGTIDVAFAQSNYGIGVGETQPNLKLAYPQFVTPMPSVLGIAAKAPAAVQAEAKQFVEFVLSPQGQQAMQAGDPHGDSLYWPVLNGVAARPEVPSPATIPTKTVDPSTWGAQENTISQWFTSHIAG
ncbi:extracellular solute-binding protein [Pseudonocardia sp.]|uniref:ABC transporter substrate-binding protein n=1 Tax=Pseudonocardia sp. TaxID=60912 RepID=UPI0031FD32D2